jgi:hypothetical protein
VAIETKPSTQAPVAAANEVAVETPASRSTKSKKKKVSKEAKPFERLDRDLSKAERRVAKAILLGVESWQNNSKKSSKKKRDGAMRDALKNGVRAYSKFVDHAAKVPGDVISMLYPYKS